MIDENEKSYIICKQCTKIANCNHYNDIINTIDKFKNTPLNIHFPMCSEYESQLYKLFKDRKLLDEPNLPYLDKNLKETIDLFVNKYIKNTYR